ncbi:hypothetical protein IC235_15035 [Hymenobacter sp. BT664]|uniref:Uncharacterized protein n=1 Tax=Hymenobacter montanus TaxID=2771359 RepID=A0A927BE72_9BACT|nr:hypothetical protein [Hymenobacter montanus]MBD2769205.1 hypothetical protein [Hymenobacter montanus]
MQPSSITPFLVLTLTAGTATAQSVQVKHQMLTVDGVEVGPVAEEKLPADVYRYHFSDTAGHELFTAEWHTLGTQYYLTLALPGYERKADLQFVPTGIGLNPAKIIANQLIKNNGLLANKSWDMAAIRHYIDTHDQAMSDLAKSERDALSRAAEAAKNMDLKVLPNGRITAYGGKPFGRYVVQNEAERRIQFYNAANELVAAGAPVYGSSRRYAYNMRRDNTLIEVDGEFSPGITEQPQYFLAMARQGLMAQLAKGYWSAADSSRIPVAVRQQAALEAGVNVVNQPGKVVLADGTVKEGTINLAFIKHPEKGITDLDFGERLSFNYKNESGKGKNATYKPQELKSFEAGGRTFESGQVQQPLMKENHFLEVVYRAGKAGLFKWYADNGMSSLVFKADDLGLTVPLGALTKGRKGAKGVYEKCPALEKWIATHQPAADEAGGKEVVDAYCR